MKGLYSNRSTAGDFVQNGFYEHLEDEMDIFIATAFFTDADVVGKLADRKCKVRIVVRLGFPTSPDALDRLLKYPNIEARFYTSRAFHPKFYIFGDLDSNLKCIKA